MASIIEQFREQITQMVKNSRGQAVITADNVFQEANLVNQGYFYDIIKQVLLPGSDIKGFENLLDLYNRAQAGESCLFLMEHYSNFDLPALFYLIDKKQDSENKITDVLVAIAGMKLNEEHPSVLALTEAFSRIVIYPSRSLASVQDPEKLEEEKKKSNTINMAAMKAMTKAKNTGKIILVFPSGTRYRPGDPSTKKGVKEIDTYLRTFQNMVFVSVNGNALEISQKGGMIDDVGKKDIITFNVGPVMSTKEFRKKCQEECGEEDPRQYTVDKIMEALERMHRSEEPLRQNLLAKIR